MRRILALALLATTALAAPAQAAGLTGMGANIYGGFFNFSKANLEEQPVQKITVGKVSIDLQHTRLTELTKAFGGTIQTDGDATWLCYHVGDTNNWFISNALGGQEFVMMVAVEASTRIPGDCEATDKFDAVAFDVPGIGAKTADIKAHFGSAPGSSKITYRADKPGGYTDNAQYLGYLMKSGKVAGIGVGETSIPTTH